jgi:hypothetical protein
MIDGMVRLRELEEMRKWASEQDRRLLDLVVALAAEDLSPTYVREDLVAMAREILEAL